MKTCAFLLLDKFVPQTLVYGTCSRYGINTVDFSGIVDDQALFLDKSFTLSCLDIIGYVKRNGLKTDNKRAGEDIKTMLLNHELVALKKIEKFITKRGYQAKFARFNKKKTSIQKEINAARDADYAKTGRSGLPQINANNIANSSTDVAVALQKKYDKFIQKNNLLYKSQFYTAVKSPAFNAGDLFLNIELGLPKTVNLQLFSSNNIYAITEQLEKTRQGTVQKQFDAVKSLIRDLLRLSPAVKICFDSTYQVASCEKKVNINNLKIEDFVLLEAGEVLSIVT